MMATITSSQLGTLEVQHNIYPNIYSKYIWVCYEHNAGRQVVLGSSLKAGPLSQWQPGHVHHISTFSNVCSSRNTTRSGSQGTTNHLLIFISPWFSGDLFLFILNLFITEYHLLNTRTISYGKNIWVSEQVILATCFKERKEIKKSAYTN